MTQRSAASPSLRSAARTISGSGLERSASSASVTAAKSPYAGKVARHEDRLLPLGDRLVVAADELRNELVRAFADQPAHFLEGDLETGFGERLDESGGVRVVAVDEGPIDVEDYALELQ